MKLFPGCPVETPHLQGFHLLEAHEDWLILVTDTLGHGLQRELPQLVAECLAQLRSGLLHCMAHEDRLFAAIGHPLSHEHREAHHHLLQRLAELSCRHASGEAVGEQLLAELQHWLHAHCGELHSRALH